MASCICLCSCGQEERVVIEQDPSTLHYAYYKAGAKTSQKTAHPESEFGKTDWFFHCQTFFRVASESQVISPNATKVRVKIKAVRMKLSLPITVLLPQPANKIVEAHESGHVAICRRLYDAAVKKTASDCAGKMLDRVMEAQAPNETVAVQKAVEQASEELCKSYRDATVSRVNRISAVYDNLMSTSKNRLPVEEAVNEAFQIDEKH